MILSVALLHTILSGDRIHQRTRSSVTAVPIDYGIWDVEHGQRIEVEYRLVDLCF